MASNIKNGIITHIIKLCRINTKETYVAHSINVKKFSKLLEILKHISHRMYDLHF